MLALSNTSYINLFHSVYTDGVQNLLESNVKIKPYSMKEHSLSLLKGGIVWFAVHLSYLSIKDLKTDYKSPSEFDDKTYNRLKNIYDKIKDVKKLDDKFVVKSKENFKGKKLINLGLTKHIHCKICKSLFNLSNAMHQKASEIKNIIDMMEKPVQTEFLKQVPFDEIYNSRPDSAEYIF